MRHLLRALARAPDPLSDAALLARYADDRDPAAFEVLVWRHGGMVLAACRRHLRDHHAAEDAFQATFLLLARKAGGVRSDTLAGWLHRVARRVATRAAVKSRRRRETVLVGEPTTRPTANSELSAVLDAEIDRLPDRLRQVVVLCYLGGESTEAAAARLGIPRGTVLSRLHTARAKLAARLTRRGVTPPVVGLTAVLTADQVAGGVRAAGGGIGSATILANEVLTMSGRKVVLAAAVGLVLAGGAGTGVGVLNAQSEESPKAVPARPTALKAASGAADDQTPAKQTDPSSSVKVAIAKLSAQIARNEAILQDSADLVQKIEQSEKAIRFFESEIVRLTARRSVLQSQSSSARRLETEQEVDAATKELPKALAADPEHVARSRLVADLWQEKVQAEAAGKEAAEVTRRLSAANKLLAETKARVQDDFTTNRRRVRESIAQAHEQVTKEILAVTEKEIEGVMASRKAREEDIIMLSKKLTSFTTERVEDLRDRLRRLRDQRDRIDLELALGRSIDDPSTSKLDSILAELRDLRRLVEGKK